MNTDARRFAPLGLVLSALAVLGFIVTLIIKGLAFAKLFVPPDPTLLDKALWISVGVFVLGLALSAFLNPEGARNFLFGRQMQYGSNAAIMLIAFVGILFFLNLIAYQNPKTWDLTEDQQNTLAKETISTLQTLPQPVTATAYYSSQIGPDTIRKLLESFKQNSNGKFTYEIVDPVQNPLAAQNDGVTSDGTVILHMAGRQESANMPQEQDLDSALLRLINPQVRVVYFLTGHGERDTETAADNSLSLVKAALQRKNYTVKLLNLSSTNKVPDDAKTVIIAGPQQPLTSAEAGLLDAYSAKGGALIIMEEPLPLTKYGDATDPLVDLLSKWGISLDNDIIVDPNANPPYVLADPQNFGVHPISAKLRGFNVAFLPARSIKLAATAPDGITLTALAQTYPNAWGETDYKSTTATFDPSIDIKGPLVLAAAGENSTTKGRLVVFGDSQFASDLYYKQGNGDLLINAVDWAAQQQDLIGLTPKNSITRTYNPPDTLGLIGIVLTSICLIPLLVIGAGLGAWYSRRRRG